MKKTHLFFIPIITLLFFTSCDSRNQTSMMKNVTGKAGELVVVISPEAWKGESGTTIQKILSQDQLGLPQDEPLFDLINIPHEAFADIFKTTRNLVIAKISSGTDEPGIAFKNDVYAYTQAVLTVNAKDQNQFVELMNNNADKIVAFFLNAERKRLILNYSKYNKKEISKVTEEVLGVSITVPPGYKVVEKSEDFVWIRSETGAISQGILIYTYPYTDDSTFTQDYMVIKRNIFLKNNVPGPTDGSYMTTEDELPFLFNTFKKDGNYASELRGLWKVANDFMGGPFVNLSMLDLLNKRVVTLDAYVYAPQKDKRNYMRQIEAMIYSAKFIDQENIDKINAQFE